MSDVSHCVRVTLILINVVLSKCRKLEISLKVLKIFSKQRLHVAYEDERTSLDHSGTHLTSPAEFGSSPFQDGGNEFILHKLNVAFRTKKNRQQPNNVYFLEPPQ